MSVESDSSVLTPPSPVNPPPGPVDPIEAAHQRNSKIY